MERIKIDFVIGRLKAGGAERVVAVLANYFADKGHKVRIITFMDGDDYQLNPAIERVRFHKKFIINYAIFRGFFNLIYFYFRRSRRPDVISSHIDLIGYTTIPVSKLYGIKLSVSEHFNHQNQKKTLPKLFLWYVLYRLPNAVTVLTKFDMPFFSKKTKRVLVMENPCSFEPLEDLTLTREKSILAIGNLDRYIHKGFDNLLIIAAEVFKSNPDWKLRIIGGGDDGFQILKNLIRKYGIENQVELMGFRTDIKQLMAGSEIFILSSRHEGLPLVLIEAMSQRMACISYNCISGPSDIITNDVNGILVPDQDIDVMILKLKQLMNDKILRERLRNNSTLDLQKFSIENVGSKWEALFADFLHKPIAS